MSMTERSPVERVRLLREAAQSLSRVRQTLQRVDDEQVLARLLETLDQLPEAVQFWPLQSVAGLQTASGPMSDVQQALERPASVDAQEYARRLRQASDLSPVVSRRVSRPDGREAEGLFSPGATSTVGKWDASHSQPGTGKNSRPDDSKAGRGSDRKAAPSKDFAAAELEQKQTQTQTQASDAGPLAAIAKLVSEIGSAQTDSGQQKFRSQLDSFPKSSSPGKKLAAHAQLGARPSRTDSVRPQSLPRAERPLSPSLSTVRRSRLQSSEFVTQNPGTGALASVVASLWGQPAARGQRTSSVQDLRRHPQAERAPSRLLTTVPAAAAGKQQESSEQSEKSQVKTTPPAASSSVADQPAAPGTESVSDQLNRELQAQAWMSGVDLS